jgi:hypothetical protein
MANAPRSITMHNSLTIDRVQRVLNTSDLSNTLGFCIACGSEQKCEYVTLGSPCQHCHNKLGVHDAKEVLVLLHKNRQGDPVQ